MFEEMLESEFSVTHKFLNKQAHPEIVALMIWKDNNDLIFLTKGSD